MHASNCTAEQTLKTYIKCKIHHKKRILYHLNTKKTVSTFSDNIYSKIINMGWAWITVRFYGIGRIIIKCTKIDSLHSSFNSMSIGKTVALKSIFKTSCPLLWTINNK